jgi:hypothetical protein
MDFFFLALADTKKNCLNSEKVASGRAKHLLKVEKTPCRDEKYFLNLEKLPHRDENNRLNLEKAFIIRVSLFLNLEKIFLIRFFPQLHLTAAAYYSEGYHLILCNIKPFRLQPTAVSYPTTPQLNRIHQDK